MLSVVPFEVALLSLLPAPNLLAALLGDKVKHSPAVVKSAPFSKSRAPLFGGGNEIAAAKVCRKQTSSVAAIPKPTSKSTNANRFAPCMRW